MQEHKATHLAVSSKRLDDVVTTTLGAVSGAGAARDNSLRLQCGPRDVAATVANSAREASATDCVARFPRTCKVASITLVGRTCTHEGTTPTFAFAMLCEQRSPCSVRQGTRTRGHC